MFRSNVKRRISQIVARISIRPSCKSTLYYEKQNIAQSVFMLQLGQQCRGAAQ